MLIALCDDCCVYKQKMRSTTTELQAQHEKAKAQFQADMASLSEKWRNAPSFLDHVDAFLSPSEASRAPALCICTYSSVCGFPPSPAPLLVKNELLITPGGRIVSS